MTETKKTDRDRPLGLRRRAEEIARKKASQLPLAAGVPDEGDSQITPSKPEAHLALEERQRTLHELRVHQIELEMQNEELRRAQEALEALRAQYFDLYDLAPVGYVVLSERGLILEANLTAATLLGIARNALVRQPISRFILKEDQDIFYRHRILLFEKGEPQVCELRLARKDGSCFWARVEASAARDAEAASPVCRAVISDISEVKREESQREAALEALRESEERYEALFERSLDLVYIHDFEGRFIDANDAALNRLGYTREEILALSFSSLLSEDQLPLAFNTIREIRETGGQNGLAEFILRHKNGNAVHVETQGSVILSKGIPVAIQSIARDITDRKRADQALQASETRYRQLVENANEAVIVAQDGFLKFVNRTAVEMIGYSEPELRSRPFPEFIHPEDREMVVRNYRNRLAGDEDQPRYVFRLQTRDGAVKWVEIGAVLIDWEGRPATLNFLTDITERKEAETQREAAHEVIQASLWEKEVMLREIHHRVKNNMQVISSLFNLQSGHTLNLECCEILREGQTRIRSMSLVHEKLYQSLDLAKIDLAEYIQSLAVHLFHVYLIDTEQLRLETEFEDVALDINSAIPCGLILNELISNALKHAFPNGRTGVIRIELKRGKGGAVELRVADDGIGFPKDVDFRHAESFGLQIVNLLVHQLEAAIDLDRTNGTAFTVMFRELKYAPRI